MEFKWTIKLHGTTVLDVPEGKTPIDVFHEYVGKEGLPEWNDMDVDVYSVTPEQAILSQVQES